MQVITEACGTEEWDFLVNIVRQLRTAEVLTLPALTEITNCGDIEEPEGEGACYSLAQGMHKSPLVGGMGCL
jgi:hypothetical protein